MKSDLIDIQVETVAQTDKAILVHTGIKEKAAWIPLSRVEYYKNGAMPGIDIVTLPERLALEKGLI